GCGAVLRVADDGSGFDQHAVRGAGRHLGLVSMRDRASGAGGTLTVESAPGKGTAIEMEVPGG
ncbi:diguanylate cyclase, partial [Streptomyces sp. SID9944]|nr:diguanylate cyclase [Streptomyces sp. SID9944]